MTKTELLEIIDGVYAGDISREQVVIAVDAYSSALLRQTGVSSSLPLTSKVIEVAAAKAKDFHGGKSAFSAAYEEGWVDGAVWMRTQAVGNDR